MTYPQHEQPHDIYGRPLNRDAGPGYEPPQYHYDYQYDAYGRPLGPQTQVQQPPQVLVTRRRKNTARPFHLTMTILTMGAWGILVWLPLELVRLKPQKEVTTYR